MAIFVGGFLEELRDFILSRGQRSEDRSRKRSRNRLLFSPNPLRLVKQSGKDIKRIYMGNWNWS